MTVLDFFEKINNKIISGRMELAQGEIEGCFDRLLSAFHAESLSITKCSVSLQGEGVVLSGMADLAWFAASGRLTIEAVPVENGLKGVVSFSCLGEYRFVRFFQSVKYIETTPYAGFTLKYPVISGRLEEIGEGFSIEAEAVGSYEHERWTRYQHMMPEQTNAVGFYREDLHHNGLVNMDFRMDVHIAFAIRMKTENFWEPPHFFYLFIVECEKPAMKLQLPMFADNDYLKANAFFSPPLTVENVVEFLAESFHIQVSGFLPSGTVFSAFGLKYVGLVVKNHIDVKHIKEQVRQMECSFGLKEPIPTAIPGLTLMNFQVVFEASWWGGPAITTATVFAVAKLELNKYELCGKVKGQLPQMVFEGQLTLSEKQELSLAALADDSGAKLPEKWKGEGGNRIFSVTVNADARKQAVAISAEAENVLDIHIGSLKISLKQIGVSIYKAPGDFAFGIDGIVAFGSGDGEFGLSLSASYHDGWEFEGALGYGTVKVGALLMEMFGVQQEVIANRAFEIELQEISFTYSVKEGRFDFYAGFSAIWFSVFGVQPRLDATIRLGRQDKNEELTASAAFYMKVGIFTLLVQADDFFREQKMTFLVRLKLGNAYLQGVYFTKDIKGANKHFLTISMGGITLGQMAESLLRLMNPNSRSGLSKPWDVLYKISLSAFSLEINLTDKTAVFWVDIGLSIPGFLTIDKIGLSYQNGKLEYQVAGSMPGVDYTQEEPLTWDALNGTPPVPQAQKTKINYVGIGQHLSVSAKGEDIPSMLVSLSKQLKPGQPSLTYSAANGFLFGVDFVIADLFRFQAIFLDPDLYGGRIVVAASEKSPIAVLNGLMLELYYKKVSDDVGMFSCTMVVPKRFSVIQLGAVTVHIGRLHAEIYTNGSFLVDLGFPHNNDFSQSFGVEVGIFTGRGGIYFGVLKGDAVKEVPNVVDGSFSPVILLGVGLSIGLGRSFDFGVVKGGVSLMLVGIFEGVLGFYHSNNEVEKQKEALYYKIKAMAGICGTLFLSIDFKIIAVSASAQISAFCTLTMESYQDTVVELDLALKLSASIKILFITIHFSFSFHHKAVFTIPASGTAPWRIAGEKYKAYNMVAYSNGTLELFQAVKVGQWEGRVDFVPLISVKAPVENAPYCVALLGSCDLEFFTKITQMLLNWLIYSMEQEGRIYRITIQQLTPNASGQLTQEKLEAFLELNLKLYVGITVDGHEREAVSYPMPSQLSLKWNDMLVNYGENLVDGEYLNRLTEYFATLNADPSHETAQEEEGRNVVLLPLCDCITLDYYRMILSELIGRIKKLFSDITVQAADLAETASYYGTEISALIEHNPDAVASSVVLLQADYELTAGDTIKKLQEKSAADIWEQIEDIPGILRFSKEIKTEFDFDNTTAGLTAEQAAAMFYVRCSTDEITYVRYIDRILAAGVAADWAGEKPYEKELDLGLSAPYVTLAGDTVVRIGKMLALLEEEDSYPGFRQYIDSFLKENGTDRKAVRSSYHVNITTVIREDQSPADLYRRIYPDFYENPQAYSLWEQEIFEPFRKITLKEVPVEDIRLGTLVNTYGMDTVVHAAERKSLALSGEQKLALVNPGVLYREQVLSEAVSDYEEIGAMVSRFFLQGLRLLKPGQEETVPMYELLRQQMDLDTETDLTMQLQLSDSACSWIEPDTEPVVWTKEKICDSLPRRPVPERNIPAAAPDFIGQNACRSLADTCILNDTETVAWLPESVKTEIKDFRNAPTLLQDGKKQTDYCWAVVLTVYIERMAEGGYLLQGVMPEQRVLLHNLVNAAVEGLTLAFHPASPALDEGRMVSLGDENCMLVKSNLSKQTHMLFSFSGARGRNRNESFRYSAKITEQAQFLRLLWECSVIGGGFYMACAGIPEAIFTDEEKGSLKLIARFRDFSEAKNAADCVIVHGSPKSLVLVEEEKKEFVPACPPGCVGIVTELPKGESPEELYQLMSYCADIEGRKYESSPILPQEKDERILYPFTIPLYRFFDASNVYSGVGKTSRVEVGLRDVLGNYGKIGEYRFVGKYNDELMSIGEYPCTKSCFDVWESMFSVTMEYGEIQDNEQRRQALASVQKALLQMQCPDVRVYACCTVDDKEREFSEKQMEELNQYLINLTAALSSGGNVPAQVFRFPLDTGAKTEIYPLSVRVEIRRTSCGAPEDERVARAAAQLPPSEEMHSRTGFSGGWFGEGDTGVYCMPKELFLKLPAVTPYEYYGKKTPRFYALKPFSLTRITKTQTVRRYDGGQEVRVYSDCDLNEWVYRFMEDLEEFISGENAVTAAKECREQFDLLVQAKKELAEGCGKRVLPLCEEFPPSENVQKLCTDAYLKSLSSIRKLDLAASYQVDAETKTERPCRAEAALSGSTVLLPDKLTFAPGEFLLYSYEAIHKNTSEAPLLSLVNIEYNIEEGEYDSSSWIKLHKALGSPDLNFDLSAEYGFGHPLRTCPKAPAISGQSGEAGTGEGEFLLWSYGLTLSCEPWEQQTMYIQLSFMSEKKYRYANRRSLFDVMADYDCQREEILKDKNAGNYGSAYMRLAELAQETADIIGQEENEHIRQKSVIVPNGNVLLVASFSMAGEKLEVSVREETSILQKLGAKILEVETPENSRLGENVEFTVKIARLPLYLCRKIKPTVHITQNENLFSDSALKLQKDFLFTTEQISAQYFGIVPKYHKELQASTVENGAEQLFQLLKLSDEDIQADMEIAYGIDVTASKTGLLLRMPVTLIFGVKSAEEIAKNVNAWLREHSCQYGGGSLEYTVNIYNRYREKLCQAVVIFSFFW